MCKHSFDEYLKGREEFEERELTNLEKIWLAFDLQDYQKFKEILNNLSKDEYNIFVNEANQLDGWRMTMLQQDMLKMAWNKKDFKN